MVWTCNVQEKGKLNQSKQKPIGVKSQDEPDKMGNSYLEECIIDKDRCKEVMLIFKVF